MKQAKDPVVLQTTCRQPDTSTNTGCLKEDNGHKIPDISEFCNGFEWITLVTFLPDVNFHLIF